MHYKKPIPWYAIAVCLLDVAVPRSAALTVGPLLRLHGRRADHRRRPPRGLGFLHLSGHQRGRERVDQGAAGGGRRWDSKSCCVCFDFVNSANEEKTKTCITTRPIKILHKQFRVSDELDCKGFFSGSLKTADKAVFL